MEYNEIDIVDENDSPTGETADYIKIHNEKLLHRSSHVWIINNRKLVFQKRSEEIRFPNMLDCTVSGHVDTQEEPIQTAIRETKEEIGIDLNKEELGESIIFRENKRYTQNHYENEFRHIYFVEKNNLKLKTTKEVIAFKEVPLEDLKSFILDNRDKITAHSDSYINSILDEIKKRFNVNYKE